MSNRWEWRVQSPLIIFQSNNWIRSENSLTKNILQRGSPFEAEELKGIINITTGETLDKEKQDVFLNCILSEMNFMNLI